MEILTMTVYANRYMKEERKQMGGRGREINPGSDFKAKPGIIFGAKNSCSAPCPPWARALHNP